MTNAEVAEVFSQIAALLEIKGENVFKVRAYARAAEAIAALREEVSVLAARGELPQIAGIGKSIAEKIGELLEGGKCAYHQDLLKELPASLLEMLRIPGVGPKKVKLVYERLGIASLEQLEHAAREQKLRSLPGLGAKTEEDILRGIERARSHAERAPLAVAYPLAEEIVAYLKREAPVDEIQPAGSLRRMKETIGDIDILVTSKRPEEVMEAFVKLPRVEEVVARGPTKCTVVGGEGIQVDVRVVEPESFGAALQYFTGSKEHSVRLRELAVRKGIRLNEYGVFEAETGKRLGGAREEEMYQALGLPWIPPELREDQGEMEAAQAGKLPRLVELAQIKGDLQCHSDWSDGRDTILEMATAAAARGLKYLAITDHSRSSYQANGMTAERAARQREEIEQARRRLPKGFTLLAGCEVDILKEGALDFPDKLLAGFDLVVASVHSGFKADRATMTKRIVAALENPWVDVLAHPTGRLIGQRDPYEVDMEAVLKAAARQGVAVEINAFPDRLDLKDVHARRAKELGVKIVINTDSHRPEHLDYMKFGVATARRGWLESSDVLTTRPWSRLRKQLRRHRGRAAK